MNYRRCYNCDYFSGNIKLQYKKSFRFLRLKYWRYLLFKYSPFKKGYCIISFVSEDNSGYVEVHAMEKCIFRNLEKHVKIAQIDE